MRSIKYTHDLISRAKSVYDSVIVCYSGGKDSVATLDLVLQHYQPEQVRAYYLYHFPGVQCEEGPVARAEQRFGIKIRRYPHPDMVSHLKSGHLLPRGFHFQRQYHHVDVYRTVREHTGAKLLAAGHRMDESLQRRGMMKKYAGLDRDHHKLWPLWDWNSKSVLAYLRMRKLSGIVMDTGATDTSGISLSTGCLVWMMENHPEDYKIVCKMFPFVHTKVLRETLRDRSPVGRGEPETEGAIIARA